MYVCMYVCMYVNVCMTWAAGPCSSPSQWARYILYIYANYILSSLLGKKCVCVCLTVNVFISIIYI